MAARANPSGETIPLVIGRVVTGPSTRTAIALPTMANIHPEYLRSGMTEKVLK
jgi:hypothetical protein